MFDTDPTITRVALMFVIVLCYIECTLVLWTLFSVRLSSYSCRYSFCTIYPNIHSFITITAENRSNAIAALLERVYHIEMMNLYMHVARDLFTIAKSPIPNEDCIIALARIGGLYHKESAKLLHACHDIGNGYSR